MPDGKWVSKANLQTFWQMIRSNLASFVTEDVIDVLPTMLPEELNKVLPTMVGEQIDNKFGDDIGDNVTSWLTEHVTPSGSAVVVDDTLTIAGAAADAKKTGDEISGLKEDFNNTSDYISDIVSGKTEAEITSKITGWTNGRLHQSVGYSDSSKDVYGEELENVMTDKYYFDDTTYKIVFVYYSESGVNPKITPRNAISSWATSSPAQSSNSSYGYMRIQVERLDNTSISPSEVDVIRKSANSIKINKNIDFIKKNIGVASVDYGTSSAGYYQIESSTGAITYTSKNDSVAYQIDLSDCIGDVVNVKFNNPSSSSSRKTALGNENLVAVEWYNEKAMTADGFTFRPTNDNHILYVSAMKTITDLLIVAYSALALNIFDYKANKRTTMYVDGAVSASGDGTKLNPFKTIQEAIDADAETVRVKAGTYAPISAYNLNHPIRIMLDDMPDYTSETSVDTQDLPKIVISDSTATHGVNFQNCPHVELYDIHVDGVLNHCYNLVEIDDFKAVRCYASNNITADFSGFRTYNVNGLFYNCVAWNITQDGFNLHGFGNTGFYDCIAHDCLDDGISHHNSCTGFIIGGEFYANGKGGIASPAYGSHVDINGAYCHDNRYGLYVVGNINRISKSRICNCASKNNSAEDIILQYATAVGWNNVYDSKSVSDGTFLEIN